MNNEFVTIFENNNIKNNFIYLTNDLIEKLNLNNNQRNIIKITKINNTNEPYYLSWKGKIINNKSNSIEISKYFGLNNLNNEIVFIEKMNMKLFKNITKVILKPESNQDYLLIEKYSDYFEENLLNQIDFLYYNQLFPFFLQNNNIYIYLKVSQIFYEEELINFGILTDDCIINIEYIPKTKQDNDVICNKYIKFKENNSNEIYKLKNENKIYLLSLKNYSTISRLCEEDKIYLNFKENKFPYFQNIYIGNFEKNYNLLDLPEYTLLNTIFFNNDLVEILEINLNSYICDLNNYKKILINNINIEFNCLNNKCTLEDFMNILKTNFPLILMENFIYKFDDYIFSINLNKKEDFKELFINNLNYFPIILNDFENINKNNQIHISHDLLIKYNYIKIKKMNSYIEIINDKTIKNKEIKKLEINLIKRNINYLLNNITDFMYSSIYINFSLIQYNNIINIKLILRLIYKNIRRFNYKIYLINLNIFNLDNINNSNIKNVKLFFNDLSNDILNNINNKNILIIEGIELFDIDSKMEIENINYNIENKIKIKFGKYIDKLLNKLKFNEKIYIILIRKNNIEFYKSYINFLIKNININIYNIDINLKEEEIKYCQENLKLFNNINFNSDKITLFDIKNLFYSSSNLKECLNNNNEIKEPNFSNIINLTNIKEKLSDIFLVKNQFKKFFPNSNLPIKLNPNCLLIGPSGCGKTLIANSLKNQFNLKFFTYKLSDILSKYVGESEQNIKKIFTKAKNNSPCILFFDEIDSIAPIRGTNNTDLFDRIVNQLLTFLDGIETYENIFFIGASKYPHLIDKAILRAGRMENILLCDYPTELERYNAIKFFIKIIFENRVNLDEKIETFLKNFVKSIDYYTYSDIKLGIYNCYQNINEDKSNKENIKINITEEDIIKSFKEINKIINKNEIELYKKIRENIYSFENIINIDNELIFY